MGSDDELVTSGRVRHPPGGRRVAACTAFVLGGLVPVAGCSAAADEDRGAVTAASAFVTAMANDPAEACALLAPGTREALEGDAGADCPSALGATVLPESGARLGVTVAGHSAQVRFAGDTVFLARFDDGWKVVAAGCDRSSSDPAVPYDCDVEGS